MIHYRLPKNQPAPWPVDIICMVVMAAAVVLYLIF